MLLDDDGAFCAVADGIGGTGLGSIMSEVCCEVAWGAWRALRLATGGTVTRLSEAVRLADHAASDLAAHVGGACSGATMVVAAFDGGWMGLAAVGDCRAYLLRDGSLTHVLGGGRRDAFSSVPDAACGWGVSPTPRTASLMPKVGDVIAPCTDGVWAMQPEHSMIESLGGAHRDEGSGTAERLARRLANASDQSDNASAVVITFGGTAVCEGGASPLRR